MIDTIREKVINFMDNNPLLTKLENDDWYKMEDALVDLFCEMTGTHDKSYENQASTYPTLLDQKLAETDYSEFEYQIYKKVNRHFQYEDLDTLLSEEQDYIPKNKINFYKNNADIIVNKYDDYLEYDWRGAMTDAMDFCANMEGK